MGLRERLRAARNSHPSAPTPLTRASDTKNLYSYHPVPGSPQANLGETAPNVNSERYNYDRAQLLVESIDFRGKVVMDIGCNSGWFCRELAGIGASEVIGVDDASHPEMGDGLSYAAFLEDRDRLGIQYVDFRCSGSNVDRLFGYLDRDVVDYALVLSVLHHIPDPQSFMATMGSRVTCGLVYEHHDFWPHLHDNDGRPIPSLPAGHRFGWDKDLSWRRRIGSIDSHEAEVVDFFRSKPQSQLIALHMYSNLKFLGFSEKRRPVLLLTK
jgi:SAM-dependent methyltransferase